MNSLLLAYISPETVVPLASALAAIGGAFLIFGGFLRRTFVKALRFFLRQKDSE